jgi:cobalt-zinc-cadmium efflux system outer membrane protein
LIAKAIPAAVLLTAVLTASDERERVSRGLAGRTGHSLGPANRPASRSLLFPPGISLNEKITEEQAVAIALWNNASLEVDLAQLGLARADLIDAGLLQNPTLWVLLPVGAKPFELLLNGHIDAIFRRPRRIKAARLNMDAVAAGLVQNGLNLVRDVRLAHANLALAEQKAAIARSVANLQAKIANDKGSRSGGNGGVEYYSAQKEAIAAADRAEQLRHSADMDRERLRYLMGLSGDTTELHAVVNPVLPGMPLAWPALLDAAMSARPDLRAKEIAIEVAAARTRWERSRILGLLTAILSSKRVGQEGILSGPGFLVEAPILNRNQGRISRAEAEMACAAREYIALRHRIELEIRQVRISVVAALETAGRVRNGILPAAQQIAQLAEGSHENGEAPLLHKLEALRSLNDALTAEADSIATVRKTVAELERSIGRKIEPISITVAQTTSAFLY